MQIDCKYTYTGPASEGGDPFPKYETSGAAAVDLRAVECVWVRPGEVKAVRTGLYLALPEGVAGIILPRSGLGNRGLVLGNLTGLIDSDYRGELIISAWNRNMNGKSIHIEEGSRCAQLMFVPYIRAQLNRVDELSETARGAGGFGSTG